MDKLFQGDALSVTVAAVLLMMSLFSWIVIVWKGWILYRAQRDLPRSMAAFWQAAHLQDALTQLAVFDRDALVAPLVVAAQQPSRGTLAASAQRADQLTRVLRDALHAILLRLQTGQVLLATVGSTAPFVGLLGTVWGIYHALMEISTAGQISIDKISGPVGEALVMTAAGLAVAIPAVVGYNILGRALGRIEADLEGFARDLRELLASPAKPDTPEV
jgi:biopolymer transport protein ExbB